MIFKELRALLLPLAACVALSSPAHAQPGDAQAARSQVQWALGNIDQLLAEFQGIDGEGRDLDRQKQQLNSYADRVDNTVRNYNMNCTSAGTRANQCPQWSREINDGNAHLKREFNQLDQRYDALNARSSQLNGRIDQMRMRMMDNVQALATACRGAPPAERDAYCNIPGGGRYNRKYVNEASNRLRSMM